MNDHSAPHPARVLTYRELTDGLAEAKAAGLVNEQIGADGLRLYCYTKSAVYDRAWTPFSLMARGLVLDADAGRVVATPFPKFFNVGEREDIYIPALSFETFEKLDGSLIIIFWHNGEWKTATKGALASEQAQWAARHLAETDTSALVPGVTYLAEAIYPENRIVISYDYSGLVLLTAYDEAGFEFQHIAVEAIADALGWRCAARHEYRSVGDLVAHAKTLPGTEEGFVLRFANGLRLKVKGDEYRRIHSMVSRVTPLAVWESLQARDDLEAMRRDLPEEFWADFDSIRRILSGRVDGIVSEVSHAAASVATLSDKDVGLRLGEFSETVRKLIFPYRKSGAAMMDNERSRLALFRMIRPTRNELAGYVPSSAVARFESESA
jgi:RNA ligase